MSTTQTVKVESTSVTIETDGIEVRIDPDLILDALKISHAWIPIEDADEHCDCGEPCPPEHEGLFDDQAAVRQIMEDWHNGQHAGVFRFCYEQPCHDLRKAGDPYP